MNGKRQTYRTLQIEAEGVVYAEFGRRVGVRGGARKLAQEAGVHEAMISQVSAGRQPMTPKIARALGFRLRYERIPRPPGPGDVCNSCGRNWEEFSPAATCDRGGCPWGGDF